jgi:16S rRNA (uracil1498-N3)-methyltransferase
MGRLWRVHHPGAADAEGRLLDLEAHEADHVRRVLRLRPGDALGVFDGAGREWRASLVRCDATAVTVRLDEPRSAPVESPLPLALFQGECRPERLDWVVQKATEIGVSELRIVAGVTGRPRGPGDRLSRWRRIAVEACKQSGRRRLPLIELAAELPPVEPGTLGLLLDPLDGGAALGAVCAGHAPARVWLAVGAEEGFDAGRRSAALERGWRLAGLGPRTLRSETAGLVAAAIVLHLWADVGPRLPPGSGPPGFDTPGSCS